MRAPLRVTALVLAAAVAVALAAGCGRSARQAAGASGGGQARPLFGVTEDDAALLWRPGQGPGAAAAFGSARLELTALHPAYVRLLVNWAALQPDPARPPALSRTVSGCARQVGPCGAYAGIAGELAAIASQQRAGAGFRVVIDIFGTPAWAAAAIAGCEPRATAPFARALRPAAIASYRALVAALLALGEREGVALEWWSPWNEPNDPRFLSPQRGSCAPGSPPVAPAAYAQLARALEAELSAHSGSHHLLLGELGDLQTDTPHSTSIAAFVAALPADVLCSSETWSVHAYATHTPAPSGADAVTALEQALDGRGPCGRDARIWVTEAGAGAPHPGRPRPPGAADELAGCLALAAQLQRWSADPRVDAVLQYTFREDPDFPVGLVSAGLSHVYPAYRLWHVFAGRRGGEAPPPPRRGCA